MWGYVRMPHSPLPRPHPKPNSGIHFSRYRGWWHTLWVGCYLHSLFSQSRWLLLFTTLPTLCWASFPCGKGYIMRQLRRIMTWTTYYHQVAAPPTIVPADSRNPLARFSSSLPPTPTSGREPRSCSIAWEGQPRESRSWWHHERSAVRFRIIFLISGLVAFEIHAKPLFLFLFFLRDSSGRRSSSALLRASGTKYPYTRYINLDDVVRFRSIFFSL